MSGTIYGLAEGSEVSNCPLPCTRTKTKTKFQNEYKSEQAKIEIIFSSKLRVTKTEFVTLTFSSFLSEVR